MLKTLLACTCFFLLLVCDALAGVPIRFWDSPQYGGNSFNRLPPTLGYFKALKGYGATWVRLSYDKWQPQQRDFLLGSADRYTGLMPADLAALNATLDRAHAAGLKVVITPLSLPGMRWAQNNNNRFDDRLWQDKAYWEQAAQFWQDLASELKNHPAVAAYNLINEPAPERQGQLAEHATAQAMQAWYAQHAQTARDLPAFYNQLIKAIREVDPNTPIMVDAGWYGAADAFEYWPKRLNDSKVLYSVHMYEPYAATSAPNMKRAKPYRYPGMVPFAGQERLWNKAQVASYLQQPLQWANRQQLASNRLVVGEFGCMRRLAGCQQYLEDVLSTLDKAQVHWAFYSFREDSWDGMDYELGTAKVPWAYWQAIERQQPDPLPRTATPAFEPIRSRLAADKTQPNQP